MKYLEARKLVHRDLAARNVLVGEIISGIPIVKVADFGLARKLMEDIYEAQEGTKCPIKCSTIAFFSRIIRFYLGTAPEAINLRNYTVKSDVWSYGVLLFEVFSRGCSPYAGKLFLLLIILSDLYFLIGLTNCQAIAKIGEGERLPCPKIKGNLGLVYSSNFFNFIRDWQTGTSQSYLHASNAQVLGA